MFLDSSDDGFYIKSFDGYMEGDILNHLGSKHQKDDLLSHVGRFIKSYRSLLNCVLLRPRTLLIIDTCLTHLHTYAPYAPYPPARLRAWNLINRRITRLCLVLCCVAATEWKGMFCVIAPINHSPPTSLPSLILPYKAVCMLFSFL